VSATPRARGYAIVAVSSGAICSAALGGLPSYDITSSPDTVHVVSGARRHQSESVRRCSLDGSAVSTVLNPSMWKQRCASRASSREGRVSATRYQTRLGFTTIRRRIVQVCRGRFEARVRTVRTRETRPTPHPIARARRGWNPGKLELTRRNSRSFLRSAQCYYLSERRHDFALSTIAQGREGIDTCFVWLATRPPRA